jgi:hypothetical protein
MQSKIIKDIEKGLSHDAIVGKYVNKWCDNVDQIKNIIKTYKWEQYKKFGRRFV